MAKSGFSAVYLDSGNHGGTYLNFTPACSGESGGGSGYVKGNQALVKVTNKSTLNFEILLDNKAGTILGNATVEIKVRLDDKVKFTTTHITDDSRLVIDIASLR